MHHVALGRLPDQAFEGRLGTLGLVGGDLPLGRIGQRNPQALLQQLIAIHRHPHAVSPESDHAAYRRVVLFLADACGPVGGDQRVKRLHRSFWR